MRQATVAIVSLIGPASSTVIANTLGMDHAEAKEMLEGLTERGRLMWQDDGNGGLYDIPQPGPTDTIRDWLKLVQDGQQFALQEIQDETGIEYKTIHSIIARIPGVRRDDRGIYSYHPNQQEG